MPVALAIQLKSWPYVEMSGHLSSPQLRGRRVGRLLVGKRVSASVCFGEDLDLKRFA